PVNSFQSTTLRASAEAFGDRPLEEMAQPDEHSVYTDESMRPTCRADRFDVGLRHAGISATASSDSRRVSSPRLVRSGTHHSYRWDRKPILSASTRLNCSRGQIC